jgi:Ser/Thr protein kinase RdoA (MazF antagonist)
MTARHHQSHGWQGDAVTPDWPALTAADVQFLLSHYPGLGGAARITWHSPRPFSAAARVRTVAGELFVKRHSPRVRSVQALEEEHAFIAHLATRGLPVPKVLATVQGDTALALGGWTYEVHRLADGVDVYRDAASWTPPRSNAHARSAGNMLARLHLAAADFAAPGRSTRLLTATDTLLHAPDLLAAIAAQCDARPALADALQAYPWRDQLRELLPQHQRLQPLLASQPRVWTHGDWHVSNLFWKDHSHTSGIRSILDFGLCAPTFALFDVATAIERNAVDWLHLHRGMRAVFPDIARHLLAGYAEVSPLQPAQCALLAELLPLVHLDFALSEVEYFHAITCKPADVDVAWTDFLLGHAHWFQTDHAQPLLALIRGFH